MWDYLFRLLEPLGELFVRVYAADERPAARRFTIGCGVLVVVIVVVVSLFALR